MTEPVPQENPTPPGPAAPQEQPWSAHFLEGLKELSPVVWVMGVMSLTLPGIVGTVVLFGTPAKAERVKQIVDSMGPHAPWMLVGIFGFATGSALAPTYALSYACGAVFGSLALGGTVAVSGVVLGALVGYLWGVLLARKPVMDVINRHEKARIIRHALVDRSLLTETWVVGLIRFPPNSPFSLTNLALSSLKVRLPAYLIGTFFGMLPRTLFATWIGMVVGDLAKAQSANKVLRLVVAGVLSVIVFVLIYRVMSKWARQALAEHAMGRSA